MCSIAAGLRSSNSTVARIASSTDEKDQSHPFSCGSGDIFNSAEKIAASVPSLPARISFKLSGARRKRSIPYPGHLFSRPGGHLSAIFGRRERELDSRNLPLAPGLGNVCMFRPHLLNPAVGRYNLKRDKTWSAVVP